VVALSRAVSISDYTLAGHRSVYEETWYDTLGGRVMVRSRRDANCTVFSDECVSALTRYIWDGDQVLYEVRVDGSDTTSWSSMRMDAASSTGVQWPFSPFGIVGYTHVTGIDLPSPITKGTGAAAQVLVPHADWRSEFDSANVVTGAVPNVRWPAKTETLDAAPATSNALYDWFGDLSGGNTTASGQKYMRNRYYDPTTGKFTQRDPAGLAGGLNLYGYAGGDAVNYNDAFGLGDCPKGTVAPVKPEGEGGPCFDEAAVLIGAISMIFDTAEMGLSSLMNLFRTAKAASVIRANNAAGKAHEAEVAAQVESEGWEVGREVTMKTESGARTRMDIVATKDGAVRCIECKSSETAPLTPGQAATHPEIQSGGATVVGKGKPNVPGGSRIPPTRVEVVRKRN
jgi:RHS repeat-associated protein